MPTLLPRLNVTVTREQHALLLELASLDPETSSAASFIRQLIDQVTPLLRVTVPAMRAAKDAHSDARAEIGGMIEELQRVAAQPDLLTPSTGPRAPSGSEGARPAKRSRK